MLIKPDPIGPQRAVPASPARLRAQHAQLLREFIHGNVMPDPDERWCPDCGTILNVLVSTCSFCGHENNHT